MKIKRLVSMLVILVFMFSCIPSSVTFAKDPWAEMEARYVLSDLSSAIIPIRRAIFILCRTRLSYRAALSE